VDLPGGRGEPPCAASSTAGLRRTDLVLRQRISP
jgi:hypothetical protein